MASNGTGIARRARERERKMAGCESWSFVDLVWRAANIRIQFFRLPRSDWTVSPKLRDEFGQYEGDPRLFGDGER